MHPNPAFRSSADTRTPALLRDRAFGTLAVHHPTGPLLAHVPFVLNGDASSLDTHLARANPIVPALSQDKPVAAVVAVTGPDAYVSPAWYGPDATGQVPTWNYVAAHARGTLTTRPGDALLPHLRELSAAFEARVAEQHPGHTPWSPDHLPADRLAALAQGIVAVRLTIESIDATWKLGQNKPDAARHHAADAVVTSAIGTQTSALAALMRAATPA